MESVFVRHSEQVMFYERVLGPVDGGIVFAMAILSDAQEMTDPDDIREQVGEAKELLAAALDFHLKS